MIVDGYAALSILILFVYICNVGPFKVCYEIYIFFIVEGWTFTISSLLLILLDSSHWYPCQIFLIFVGHIYSCDLDLVLQIYTTEVLKSKHYIFVSGLCSVVLQKMFVTFFFLIIEKSYLDQVVGFHLFTLFSTNQMVFLMYVPI